MHRSTNPSDFDAQETPAIVAFPSLETASKPSQAAAPCDLTAQFIRQFEQASGWEVHFVPDQSSQLRWPEVGHFEIVDMSADWPARQSRMSRQHCDYLIALFSQLVASKRRTEANLAEIQSVFSGNNDTGDDEYLVDSFVTPLTPRRRDEFELQDVVETDEDSEFVVRQAVMSDRLVGDGAWSDWSVAGAVGISGDRYLDWAKDENKMTLYVGRLESSLGTDDTESVLEICGRRCKFHVVGQPQLSTFFLWDRRGSQLSRIQPGDWQMFPPGGAIVVATTTDVTLPSTIKDLDCAEVSAEQILHALEQQVDPTERLFVVKYY